MFVCAAAFSFICHIWRISSVSQKLAIRHSRNITWALPLAMPSLSMVLIRPRLFIRHQQHRHRHRLLHPPPQRWNDSSFCQRNCSSLGLQTTGVRAAVPALVPRCMPKSTSKFMFTHELWTSLPEEDAITFWRRRQAAYSLLVPLARDLVAAPASQAYVERDFSVCGWLTVGRRNRLS